MRTSGDCLRSLKKYVAECLPGWEVRLDNIITKDPLAIVRQTTPVTFGGDRWAADESMGVQVALYLGPRANEEIAVLDAAKGEALLFRAFRQGVGLGRPLRVPLYDYDGIGPDHSSDARETKDFMRLSNVIVNALPEPEDRSLMTIVCTMTVTWRRAGELPAIERGPVPDDIATVIKQKIIGM